MDITTFINTPGKRIWLARVSQNIKQRDLAQRCQMPPSLLCAIERGEKNLTAQRLATIAETLGVSMDYIQRGVDHA